MKRTHSTPLAKAFWHPYVLVPLTVAILSIFFLNVYRSIGIPGLIFGLLGSIIGFLFNLMMLKMYPEQEKQNQVIPVDSLSTPPTIPELENKLVGLANSEEILTSLQRFEIILQDVREALFSTQLDPSIRQNFLPTIGQNENSAMRLTMRLIDIQTRLNSLENSASKHGQGFDTRIEQLKNQRSRIMSHLEQLTCTLEQLVTDLAEHLETPSRQAEENLKNLKDSLNELHRKEEKEE